MQFRSRKVQSHGPSSIGFNLFSLRSTPNDTIFDGIELPKSSVAVGWLKENAVHQSLKITDKAATSAPFLSFQVSAVRDEVRKITHLLTQERDGLFLTKIRDVSIIERIHVTASDVKRFSIALRKYDGSPIISYISGGRIFLNDTQISTASGNVDFPSISIDQPPIGHNAATPPEFGVLSYKCRNTGNLYLRTFDPITLVLGNEIDIVAQNAIGGGDIVSFNGEIRVHVDSYNDAKLEPLIGTYQIASLTSPINLQPLDLTGIPHDEILPTASPSFVDFTGSYHIPLLIRHGETFSLIDLMPDDDLGVEAIKVACEPTTGFLQAFPSKPEIYGTLRPGFGDGSSDGNGIIATVATHGDLLSSNSQSGGNSYPEFGLLNHEMPKIFSVRATQCYTRGAAPNMVSMDYAFIEADSRGNAVDSTIWLETWDMPLPEPVLNAVVNGSVVTLDIVKGGWFVPGKTVFDLHDPQSEISSVSFRSDRSAELTLTRQPISGSKVKFETRTDFFHHAGHAVIM